MPNMPTLTLIGSGPMMLGCAGFGCGGFGCVRLGFDVAALLPTYSSRLMPTVCSSNQQSGICHSDSVAGIRFLRNPYIETGISIPPTMLNAIWMVDTAEPLPYGRPGDGSPNLLVPRAQTRCFPFFSTAGSSPASLHRLAHRPAVLRLISSSRITAAIGLSRLLV